MKTVLSRVDGKLEFFADTVRFEVEVDRAGVRLVVSGVTLGFCLTVELQSLGEVKTTRDQLRAAARELSRFIKQE